MAIHQDKKSNSAADRSRSRPSAPVLFRLPNLRGDAPHGTQQSNPQNAAADSPHSNISAATDSSANPSSGSSEKTISGQSNRSASTETQTAAGETADRVTNKRWSSGVVLFSIAMLIAVVCYLGMPTRDEIIGDDPTDAILADADLSSETLGLAVSTGEMVRVDSTNSEAVQPEQIQSPTSNLYVAQRPAHAASTTVTESKLASKAQNSSATSSATVESGPVGLLLGGDTTTDASNNEATQPETETVDAGATLLLGSRSTTSGPSLLSANASDAAATPTPGSDPPSLGGATADLVAGNVSSSATKNAPPLTETDAAGLDIQQLMAARQNLNSGRPAGQTGTIPSRAVSTSTRSNVVSTGTPNFQPAALPPASPGYSTNMQAPVDNPTHQKPPAYQPVQFNSDQSNSGQFSGGSAQPTAGGPKLPPYQPISNPAAAPTRPYQPINDFSNPGM